MRDRFLGVELWASQVELWASQVELWTNCEKKFFDDVCVCSTHTCPTGGLSVCVLYTHLSD